MDRRLLDGLQIATAIVTAAIVILTWFFLRDQFSWAVNLVFCAILFIVLLEYLKVRQWLRDTVSIQVIIHKNENAGKK